MARGIGESTGKAGMSKAELRKRMREETQRHAPEERAAASRQICERIRAQAIWQAAKSVMLFAPMANEPDVSPLMQDGKRLSLPCSIGKEYEVRDVVEDLIPGRFGIREPSPNAPLTGLAQVDLVLVPGVAFALDGSRLGRGQGFYDRLLAIIGAAKCGVCFEWQIVPTIPREGHDVAMNYIVTPSQWLTSRPAS